MKKNLFSIFTVIFMFVVAICSCQSSTRRFHRPAHQHFTLTERIDLLTHTFDQSGNCHLVTERETGKITLNLFFPIEQISKLAGTIDTMKMIGWIQNRYNSILGDFVAGEDARNFGGFNFYLTDLSMNHCYKSIEQEVTKYDTGSFPETSTKEKLDCLVRSFPDSAYYTCDSNQHKIIVFINPYLDYSPDKLEKTFNDKAKKYGQLTFAYILQNDPNVDTLEFEFTNTNRQYERQMFKFQFNINDDLFANLKPSIKKWTLE